MQATPFLSVGVYLEVLTISYGKEQSAGILGASHLFLQNRRFRIELDQAPLVAPQKEGALQHNSCKA